MNVSRIQNLVTHHVELGRDLVLTSLRDPIRGALRKEIDLHQILQVVLLRIQIAHHLVHVELLEVIRVGPNGDLEVWTLQSV